MEQAECDFLIVGGGTAGSVLAARLSEDPAISVTLVEAGDDVLPGEEPADVRNVFPLAVFNRRYFWPDTIVHWDAIGRGAPTRMLQARIMGGGSAVMGMWALRGRPEDYDDWEAAGARGWSWNDVLPYFCKLESDADYAGPLHGADGPIPIRRERRDEWAPFAEAVAQSLASHGFRHIDDMNADFRDGHCSLPVSRHQQSRAAAGICYLDAGVRARANLRVLPRLEARRLLFEGRRIGGIEARDAAGRPCTLRARETLLAAGALRSPALLLRSGIGDEQALRMAGIKPVLHRPGVGRNLQNHPVVYTAAVLKPAGRQPRAWRPAGSTYARYSSGLAGAPAGDMALYVRSYLSWHETGRRMASIAPLVARPDSRGRVSLDPADPDGPCRIEFGFGSQQRDLDRLAHGLRFALDLLASPPVRAVCGDAWVLLEPAHATRFNELTALNAAGASVLARLLDLGPRVERTMLSRSPHFLHASKLPLEPEALLDLVRAHVTGTGHVCGTCRMGLSDDPLAVVDSEGRVHGIAGLRVVDASVMPNVPSGNTHIPTVMVAEKLAAAIRMKHHAECARAENLNLKETT